MKNHRINWEAFAILVGVILIPLIVGYLVPMPSSLMDARTFPLGDKWVWGMFILFGLGIVCVAGWLIFEIFFPEKEDKQNSIERQGQK